MLELEYDPAKRQITLENRQLDFADANQVFDGIHYTAQDQRQDYGENRYITAGYLNTRLVVIVWTYRPNETAPTHRRIISMRKANERESQYFQQYLA